SLDHLIGAGEHRWRHVEAKRLGGLEVDDQVVFGGRHKTGTRRSAIADKDIIIGRVINLTGMIGVSGGNRLVGVWSCIAPISAWLWLRYCQPLSLVLVAGEAGCSAHLKATCSANNSEMQRA